MNFNKIKLIFLTIIFILIVFVLQVKAENNYANIIVESNEQVYSKEFAIDFAIKVGGDMTYDNCFVSYHIFSDKNEIVRYDNERIPVKIENGMMSGTFSINMKELGLDKEKTYIFKLDILDLNNEVWFSDGEIENFETDEVILKYDGWKAFIEQLKKEFIESPVIASINIIAFLATIVGIICVKKKLEL